MDEFWGSNWALYVFNTAFSEGVSDQGLAAAAATILVAIGAALGVVALKLMRFEQMMAEPRGEI